jgi:hypothetical protein
MEISAMIMASAVTASVAASPNAELAGLLASLEHLSLEEFPRSDHAPALRKADLQIRAIVAAAADTNHQSDKLIINNIAAILSAARSYLQKGIVDADLRPIFIYLMAANYLTFEAVTLLSPDEKERLPALSAAVAQKLAKGKVELHPKPTAGAGDQELINSSAEAFQSGNISRAYVMIDALENGKGFHFAYLVSKLMHFLFQIDYPLFLSTLSSKVYPLEYAYYLANYTIAELQRLADEASLHDKWLNFEVIRCLSRQAEKNSSAVEIRGVVQALRRIWATDTDFICQVAAYFHRSSFVQKALGEFLATTDDIEFSTFLKNSYPVRQAALDLEPRNIQLKQFAESAPNEQLKAFLCAAYDLWDKFIQDCITTGNFASDDLLLTDYFDTVVNYYDIVISDPDIVASMHAVITILEQLDSQWAVSANQQTARFKLLHSQLYLMSFSCKNRGLKNAELLGAYIRLTTHPIRQARFRTQNLQRYFDVIKKNLGN